MVSNQMQSPEKLSFSTKWNKYRCVTHTWADLWKCTCCFARRVNNHLSTGTWSWIESTGDPLLLPGCHRNISPRAASGQLHTHPPVLAALHSSLMSTYLCLYGVQQSQAALHSEWMLFVQSAVLRGDLKLPLFYSLIVLLLYPQHCLSERFTVSTLLQQLARC